jgi:sensor histidine kinase YesM
MSLNNFIFSEKRKGHIKRHLVFWLFWWLYFGLLHAANPFGLAEIAYFKNIPYATLESLLLLVPHIFLTYILLLYVLPRYLMKGKYFQTILNIILLVIISAFINLYLVKNISPWILSHILPAKFQVNTQRPPATSFFMAMMNAFKGGLTVAAIAVSIKMIKFWYLKEQRNLQLQKENTEAQLQLLTAQVHPHFLFNTLNNVYSQTQTTSPIGSKMIMELSDLLRYILYEGKKPLVPLKKELLMIQEYISLEKIRYGNKLDIHYLITDNTDDIYIAPLLLIPFVENCFKHGASNMLERPWINLTIELKDTTLVMKLMNGKAAVIPVDTNRQGIGIENVRKRLALLYHNKHELLVREEEEVFVVDLKVQLERITDTISQDSKTPVYLEHA